MPTNSALHLDHLSFSYPDRPDVLQDITLTIAPGERVGIIGPNGTGKTTLFLLLCGILKPQSGTISCFGTFVRHQTYLPDIGLVFQDPNDQLFCPSVSDDIAFGPINMGLADDIIAERVANAVRITDTEALLHRIPHHLSGGEKRMVAIASVLAMHPRLVIYDEPSTGLDIHARRRLIHFLQQADHTVLLASHDLELVREVCTRVIILDGGSVVADGAPVEIMSDTSLMEAHRLECPASLVQIIAHRSV